MTEFGNYELVFTGKKKGTDHDGYCSDAYDFVEIEETNITWSTPVPSKEFVKNSVDSNGEIEFWALNSFDTETRICSGSGYCGCSIKTTAISGRLVQKSNIKSCFLNEYPINEGDQKVKHSHSLTETRTRTHEPKNTVRSFINLNKNYRKSIPKTNKLYTRTYQNPPKFYSESYKARCSTIQCRWGDKCRYKDIGERQCFFKH
jgi:hypothetical protein